MKLSKLKIENFRSYKEETTIDFNDITAFIGKNDVGKSTILEALEIFFNNKIIKIDQSDACVFSTSKEVKISCIFNDLPEVIVLDTSSKTSLSSEFLLNSEGELEICKVYDCNKKNPISKVYAVANHPSTKPFNSLLSLTNTKLKSLLENLEVSIDQIDLRSNAQLRSFIWGAQQNLELKHTLIDLSKSDAKCVWDQIEKNLPIYALFQSDRSSSDGDSEVQDPMKLAVQQALESVQDQLDNIKKTVQTEVLGVAKLTLSKLQEMDKTLAAKLNPIFKEDPKWSTLFKLSLEGDDNIPINKRGSGVRRLILLNFFRAEAERRRNEVLKKNVIYAIEEPETAQHPDNQKKLVNAFKDLVDNDNAQVILTTHVPGFAELIPVNDLRYIEKIRETRLINKANEETNIKVATALGVYPNPISKQDKKVIVCVEGVNDVTALYDLSDIVSKDRPELINLRTNNRVTIIPLGGSALKEWVQHQYLKNLRCPEVHIYDRDDKIKPKYQNQCDQVNQRSDGSKGFLTLKREMENYIHPDTIEKILGVRVQQGDWEDIPNAIAKLVHEKSGDGLSWSEVSEKKRKQKEGRIKKRLNNEVIKCMSIEQLREIDTNLEIENWLLTITELCTDKFVRL